MNRFYYLTLSLSMFGCAVATQNTHNTNSARQFTPKIKQEKLKPNLKPKAKTVIEKDRIAVINLRNKAGVKQDESNYLSDILRDVASKLPHQKYSVMTEDNIQVMLPPETKLEDCAGVCAVTTGRNIGAHWVLVGSVVRFGTSLRVTIRIHHTASGEVRGSEQLKGNTIEDLEFPLRQAGLRLFSILDPALLELVKTEPKSPQVVTNNNVISTSSIVSGQEPQIHIKPVASNILVSYVARISERDKYTLRGKKLNYARHIIVQDRANVHRFNLRDDEDEIDDEFKNLKRRRWLTKQLVSSKISSKVINQIMKSNPLIRVTVLHSGQVTVELASLKTGSNTPNCRLAQVKTLDPLGDNFLSVRQGPASRYLELHRLHSDELVCITKKRKKWYKISYQRNRDNTTAPCSTNTCSTGWVFGKYIEIK